MNIKPFIEALLNKTQAFDGSSNKHIDEGNKFEFEVCNLLMKGAGGAIFFYVAIAKLSPDSERLRLEPLAYLFLSLAIGIVHMLWWSRKLLKIAEREHKISALIRSEFATVADPQNPDEKKIFDLWKAIEAEEKIYSDGVSKGLRLDEHSFRYVVPMRDVYPWAILLQSGLLALGALAIFGVFSVMDLCRIFQCS